MNTKFIYLIYEGVAVLLITFCLGAMVLDRPPYHQDMVSMYGTLEKVKNKAMLSRTHPRIKVFAQLINRQDDRSEILPRFHQTRTLALKTVQRLEKHKQYLAQYPMDAQAPVKKYLIRQQAGYQITQLLDQYVQILESRSKDLDIRTFEKLTKNKVQAGLHQKIGWRIEKDFVQHHLRNISVAQALVVLTYKQIQVLDYAWEVCKRLVGPDEYYLNYGCGLIPYVKGVAQRQSYIPVGKYMEAKMVVGAVFPHWRKVKEFYAEVNGKRVKPNQEGYIPVRFKAEGKGKQYWTGLIRYCEAGVEKVRKFNIPYWVE